MTPAGYVPVIPEQDDNGRASPLTTIDPALLHIFASPSPPHTSHDPADVPMDLEPATGIPFPFNFDQALPQPQYPQDAPYPPYPSLFANVLPPPPPQFPDGLPPDFGRYYGEHELRPDADVRTVNQERREWDGSLVLAAIRVKLAEVRSMLREEEPQKELYKASGKRLNRRQRRAQLKAREEKAMAEQKEAMAEQKKAVAVRHKKQITSAGKVVGSAKVLLEEETRLFRKHLRGLPSPEFPYVRDFGDFFLRATGPVDDPTIEVGFPREGGPGALTGALRKMWRAKVGLQQRARRGKEEAARRWEERRAVSRAEEEQVAEEDHGKEEMV